MANKSGDVNLVVKARNDASKSLDIITKALTALTDTQGDLQSSSSKVSQTLDQFAKVAATVGSAYTKIQTDADKAATALARQESVLNENKAAYAALVGQMEAAGRAQDQLAKRSAELSAQQEKINRGKTRYGPPTAEVAAQIQALAAEQEQITRSAALAATAQTQLAREAARVASTISDQEKSFQKSFYTLQDLTGNAEKAAAALDKVRDAQLKAGQAAAAASTQQDAASVASVRRASLELRRDMQDAAASAKVGWKDAQNGVKDLAAEIGRVGVPTSQMVADNARLAASAAANKMAYNELQIAIEQYTRVLRNQNATQQDIAAAQERARNALQGAQNAMVNTSGAARQTATAERDLGNAGRDGANGTNELDKSLQSLFANSRRSLSLFQRLRGEVLSLISSYVGLYAAIEGVNKVIQASMQMQAVESRLNVVTGGDPKQTAAELAWVKGEADRLGFSLTTLAGEWSKFSVSAQASNFTMDQTRKIFTSVSEAGRVLKLDSQRMEQAFVAITQMMSKGTIQMEELRQQLGEHIPGAFALMAKAAGVSGAELTKMMEKGQLTSDYLLKFADVLDQRFGGQLDKSLQMTQAELGRFQTAVTLALNEIANSGVLEAFTKALRDLQEKLRSKDAEVWFQRIGAAAGGLIKILMAVGENLDLILIAMVSIGAAKGVGYIMAAVRAFTLMRLEILTATTAAKGLSVATAGIGGPLGIAIGVAAGAFALLATRIGESEKAMVSAKRAVDEISKAYREGSDDAKKWTDSLKGLTSLQLTRDMTVLKNKLNSELQDIQLPFSRSFITRARGSSSPILQAAEEMQQLAEQVRSGQMPLAEFTKRIDAIGTANPQLRETALRLQDSAAKAADTESALTKFEASIRLMRGEATEADKQLLGFADSTKDVADAQNQGAQAMGKYTDAMDRLAKKIPELKKELEFKDGIKAITQDLQTALDNAGDDEALKRAAMDQAAKATAALKDAYDEALIKEFSNTRGDTMLKTVNLLKGFEGFQPTGKWDVNAFRAGYGSDTVTLDDGTIQKVTQGMAVTQTDAMRDLVRRIAEFQEGVKRQVGSDRYSAFSPDQQAALTSIAYNYGSLPKRIIDAVKTGTSEEIAAAVRGLGGDNGGINRGRRNAEAAILGRGGSALAASTEKLISERDNKVEKVISDLTLEMKKANESKREQFIDEALKKIQAEPGKLAATPADVERVRKAAGEAFDAKENLSTQEKIAALQQQIAESKTGISREEFISNAARKDGVNLLTEQGQKYAELKGQIYDRENSEKRVNELTAQRKELQDQLTYQQNQGNFEGAAKIQTSIDGINTALRQAIDNAIKFYKELGGPNSDVAIAKLENYKNTIVTTAKVTLDAKQINTQFAQGATTGLMAMGDAAYDWVTGVKSGKEAIDSIGDAFLTFASDFLRQIAQMILQQALFNAVSSMFGSKAGGGGGLGSLISGLFSHSGGVVGEGGERGSFSPSVFANAMRYHTGGIAGLAPNEVPTILEKNEEVLTTNDPRHIMNGGGASRQPTNLKIINAIDSGSVVSDGLNTRVGEEAFINYIQANRGRIRSILG